MNDSFNQNYLAGLVIDHHEHFFPFVCKTFRLASFRMLLNHRNVTPQSCECLPVMISVVSPSLATKSKYSIAMMLYFHRQEFRKYSAQRSSTISPIY